MKKLLLISILTLTFFVSVFCLPLAYAQNCPWDVKSEISHGKDVFFYDICNTSNNQTQCLYYGKNYKLRYAKQLLSAGLDKRAVYNYVLPGFDKILEHFSYVNTAKVDSSVKFSTDGFAYTQGKDGVAIDVDKLFELLLQQKNQKITLPLDIDKCVTVAQLKAKTVQKSTFTTTFANSNGNRIHNITLATRLIDGTTVGVGESFSFNKIVGKRTEQNGYKNAKVILDGNYVDGVGGGVCQASTTLYNALLLAEIIPKASQHSLISSYVMEGFDAMVNDNGTDLSFTNPFDNPIYIKGQVVGKSVTFTIYGIPNEYKVIRKNDKVIDPFKTIQIVDSQKYPQLVYTNQTQVVQNGSNGVKSTSYLYYYKGDTLVKTLTLRKNSYKRVDKVIAHGALPPPQTQIDTIVN